jgi:hypothetical protein
MSRDKGFFAMPAISHVHVRCSHCRTRFPSFLKVPDTQAFQRLAEVGGLAECPGCHRFVVLDQQTLSYTPEGGHGDSG